MVSQESVKWLRTNNSKSVDTSRKHADFRDVATEFAPMQVNDADVPWLTHGSPFQRASRPRGLNSKPGVVSLKHLNCPWCVHGSCSNASKWQWYSVAHTQIPVSICVCAPVSICVCATFDHSGGLTQNPWWSDGITSIVRDVATEFAPMQVNDTVIPWLTHGYRRVSVMWPRISS